MTAKRIPHFGLAVTAVVTGLLFAALAGSGGSRAAIRETAALQADHGFRGPSFGTAASSPTAKDPQSKLWFNGGYWWGSLFNRTTGNFQIYRLDRQTQTWVDTGTVIDDRDRSRSDALWDGTRLYVVTSGLTSTSTSNNARVLRFSYNAATLAYTLDAGFPVTLPTGGGMEAVGIDKDTTGRAWVTYTKNQSVYVSHTTSSDTTWATPFVLPATESTGLLTQDESAIVSYNSKIGIMWSDQARTPMRYRFAVHVDGAAPNVWQSSVALQGTEIADNHMNLKALDADPAGQVFATVKTSLNAPTDPLYYLLVLRNDGTWVSHVFGTVADQHTRAQLAIDPENRKLYVMATSPCCSGGAIYYKESDLDNITFTGGLGTPLMQRAGDVNINNVSTTKQALGSSTGFAAIASDDTTDFYIHNVFDLGPDTTPPETTIESGPSGVVETGTATFTFFANEGGSTFECRVDGAPFTACSSPTTYTGLADGQHVFDVRARDTHGNTDPTPASRTWTVDTTVQVATLPAAADARVEVAAAGTNFGNAAVLIADSSPNTESYLRFDVNVPGPIISATLRLFVTNGSANGPAAYVAGNSWAEGTVTWNNKPARTGAALDDEGVLAVNTWVEFNVSAAVATNGLHTFNIVPSSSDGTDFHSREATSANKPQLVVRYQTDATPPETSVLSGPSGLTASTDATFTFSSSDSGSTFACSLDGVAFTACSSPRTYNGLAQGAHTFEVRATDAGGNTDPTPASRSWTVDTIAPAAPLLTSPSNGSTSSSSTVTVAGTAEPNSTVEVLDGAASQGTTSADGGGGWTKTLSGVADGNHSYTATARDTAGNTSPASSPPNTITIDASAPETTIDSGPSGATANTSTSFTFSANEFGSTFQCSLDGAAYADCTSPQSYTGLGQGDHTFSVRATDVAGNTDPTPAARSWSVDTLAPAAPLLTSPADGSTSANSMVTVAGTAEPNATIEVLDGVASQGTTSADGLGNWTKTLSAVADGSHSYTATARDAAGNTSPASAARSITIDTQAPNTTVDSGPSGATASTTASFTFSASESGSSFQCSLDGAAYTGCTSPQEYTGLGQGDHSFSVRATDPAGNTDPTPAGRSWTIDVTAPAVTSTVPANGAVGVPTGSNVEAVLSEAMDAATINTTTFTLVVAGTSTPVPAAVTFNAATRTATLNPDAALLVSTLYTARLVGGAGGVADVAGNPLASDVVWSFTTEALADTAPPETSIDSGPSGVVASTSATFTFSSNEPGSTFACSLDGAAFAPCASSQSYSDLAQGEHTFEVRATDGAGNTDPSPAGRSWTVDSIAPSAPVLSSPADGSTSTSSTVTVAGTAEPNTTVEVFDGASSEGTTGADGGGNWTKTLTGVADGSHSYTATARDAAGNTSPASSPPHTITIDTSAPDTSIGSGPSGATANTSASFTFSASEIGSSFQCSLDGAAYTGCTSPQEYTGLGQGDHSFSVRATDPAGNTDPTPASRSWTVDTIAPAAPVLSSPANGSTSTSSTVTVAGTAEPNSTVEVFDGAASQGTTTADGGGNWTKTLTGVADGSHSYTATARDAAGNTSPSSSPPHTTTVDANAPDTTIDTGPSGTTTATSATFTFSSEPGSTFQCSLDGAAYTGCTSPQTYNGLAETQHTFAVRATDANGNTDATPATRTWTISLALFFDGFESGNFSSWTTVVTGVDGSATVQSADVKTGAFAARLSETATAGSVAYVRKQLDTARTELTVKGDFKILQEGASGGNVPILRLFDASGTRLVSLYRQNLDADKIRVTHSGSGVTTTGRLPLNTWGFFELHVITAGAASTIEVQLDGTVIYQTNTASLGTAGVLNVQIGNETKAQAFALIADNIDVRQ